MADHLQLRGAVFVDGGAASKVRDEGKSLLPIGVTALTSLELLDLAEVGVSAQSMEALVLLRAELCQALTLYPQQLTDLCSAANGRRVP